ncbi:beta-lactamase family protein [Aestuariicella sp. G3-2]|uniref:serine hydrolase domain-containing protein n=1 Tax=Pseudomaricurvus albidus TaxID=2842452 RepID=UPI001C0B4227|nr:beta-lactamase family protein [Aestuariicella albida]
MTIINGYVSPRFEPVGQVFDNLFSEYGELGAAVTLIHQGETVVNLWAGTRDKESQLSWQEDTRLNVFSVSKALVAVAVLQLVERDVLSLDQTVASVWPEFGQAGKEGITLRQVLTHRSGVNAFHAKIPDEDIYRWDRITHWIAQETPWWTPGESQGYSPVLYGWILGEVVRRASGCRTFNDYVQQHISRPLGLNWTFGLRDDELAAIADVTALKSPSGQASGGLLAESMRNDPGGVTAQAFSNPMSLMVGTNQPPWRQAQIPAANGHASAGDLARFYMALADLKDERLLSAEIRSLCWEEQTHSARDKVLQCPISLGMGFMRLLPQGVASQRYFCHPGAGGSLGYGDNSEQFGFGFVSRAMGLSITMDERADKLLQAVYGCIRSDNGCSVCIKLDVNECEV